MRKIAIIFLIIGVLWIRQKEILMTNNIPYQRYIDAGYFQVKESTYETPFGTKTQQTTYVTGK